MKRRKDLTPKAASSPVDSAPEARASRSLRKVRTHYHPVAFSLVACVLPARWEAIPEHLLHQEPQRVDILVVLRKDPLAEAPQDEDSPEELLPSLVHRLGSMATVLEFKGPTDRLTAWDLTTVLGYGMQLCVQKHYKPEQVALGVLVSRVSQAFIGQAQVHKGKLEQTEPGLWDGQVGGFPIFVLELSRIWSRSEAEKLWYVLTPRFGKDKTPLRGLSMAQGVVYWRMYEHFKREFPSGGKEMKRYEEYLEQLVKEMLASDKRDKFLSWMSPEERVRGLRPEEVLTQFTPEDRLMGLRPEEVLTQFTPEERVSGLRPEELSVLLQQVQAKLSKPGAEAS